MLLRSGIILSRIRRIPYLLQSHSNIPVVRRSSTMTSPTSDGTKEYLPLYTRVLHIDPEDIGSFEFSKTNDYLSPWKFNPSGSDSAAHLLTGADALQMTLYPVAFPTETVYGLGANALSSAAVRGIYKAKQRPSDNPLIVHVSSLEMLRRLLDPLGTHQLAGTDPIPSIYTPLIQKFWPGPLSILLPNVTGSRIAQEVTAGQPTFAARMPSNKLALALIQLSQLPLAAPSANASTKPSPTTAQHVAHDLAGRIEFILDGGSCTVGVESTVVDGLSSPPAILRPGGIGISEIRQIIGWEDVVIGYVDEASDNSRSSEKPRAPGMKYKHYSPAARVILSAANVDWERVRERIHADVATIAEVKKIGIIATRHWQSQVDFQPRRRHKAEPTAPFSRKAAMNGNAESTPYSTVLDTDIYRTQVEVHILNIGPSTASIARGLFSALRELDLRGVQRIYVEGIDDGEGTKEGSRGERDCAIDQDGQAAAAAIMNRLRKAAAETITLEEDDYVVAERRHCTDAREFGENS